MDSVTLAKQNQQQERQRVALATGIRFVGDTPVPPIPRIVLTACTCHGCLYVAGGKSEGDSLTKLESHLRRVHGVQAPKEVA